MSAGIFAPLSPLPNSRPTPNPNLLPCHPTGGGLGSVTPRVTHLGGAVVLRLPIGTCLYRAVWS